jgi:hypothetical protein
MRTKAPFRILSTILERTPSPGSRGGKQNSELRRPEKALVAAEYKLGCSMAAILICHSPISDPERKSLKNLESVWRIS